MSHNPRVSFMRLASEFRLPFPFCVKWVHFFIHSRRLRLLVLRVSGSSLFCSVTNPRSHILQVLHSPPPSTTFYPDLFIVPRYRCRTDSGVGPFNERGPEFLLVPGDGLGSRGRGPGPKEVPTRSPFSLGVWLMLVSTDRGFGRDGEWHTVTCRRTPSQRSRHFIIIMDLVFQYSYFTQLYILLINIVTDSDLRLIYLQPIMMTISSLSTS